MKKCFAIPTENGELCAHFGHCEKFTIVEVENNTITKIKEHTPPQHVPGLYPVWVAELGATDVIAGGMGQRAIDLFNQQNINVFTGASIKPANELVNDFIENKLMLQANYCNHDDHHSTHEGCVH